MAAGAAAGFWLRWYGEPRKPLERDAQSHPEKPPEDARFDALVRALPLGIMMLDRRLRIAFANRAASAIFGFERSRARSAHLIEAVPSIELERRALAVLAGKITAAPLIVSAKTANRSYAVTVYPLTDGAEHPTGALIVAEDQTELLALERARQEFLSNVSHELRTPLSSIKLMIETVLAAEEENAVRLFLPQALAEVDRLAMLVQRFLEQARADSAQMVLCIDEVDVGQVAKTIVKSFERQAATKAIALDLCARGQVVIESDAQRLSQIFVNLIDNALRYTPEGGTVTIDLTMEDEQAVIRVKDTGIGVPYKDIPYIFERFYVVDRSRARGVGGAGLGLSIVKQIVEAHGGTVQAQSMLESGTEFIVRIPAHREQSADGTNTRRA